MQRIQHRLLAMFCAGAALAALLPACIPGLYIFAGQEAASRPQSVKFVILHTNDMHGQLLPRDARGRANEKMGGAAAIDAVVARERAAAEKAGSRLLLVDSGDWYQGTPEGNFTKDGVTGAVMVDWMNRAGFDCAVIGNHEFDFGFANVTALLARAKFTVLGANVLIPIAAGGADASRSDETQPTSSKPVSRAPMAKPYAVYEHGGVKIAIVGLLTSDTPKMVAEGRLGDVHIPDERSEARKWYKIARNEADIVLFATHCGYDVEKELAREVPASPVILGGHSHTFLRQPKFVDHEPAALDRSPWKPGVAPRTYVTQSGAKAENLDRIEIVVDPADKKIERIDAKNIELYISETGESELTKKWIEAETASVVRDMATVVGVAVAPPAAAEKKLSTDPTGNIATDALLWYSKSVDARVVAAFNNSSGIRSKLATGDITKRGLYEVIPFDNSVVIFTINGSTLLDMLENAVKGRGRVLTSGLTGVVKRTGGKGIDPAAITIGGAPLDPAAKYRVAANSFIAAGKGGFEAFETGYDRTDTGTLVRDALVSYVAAKKTIVLDDVLRLYAPSQGDRERDPAPAGAGAGKK